MRKIAVRSEQHVSPTAVDVIREAKRRAWGDAAVEVTFYDSEEDIPAHLPVLVLGKGEGDVSTLSAAQIVTKESAITDLTQAFKLLAADLVVHTIDYEVATDAAQLEEFGPDIVIDIETSGNVETDLPGEVDILSMGVNDGKRRILVIPGEWFKEWDKRVAIIRLLKTRNLTAQNGQFDFRYLNAELGTNLYAVDDTMLMHYTMNHGAKAHKLEQLAIKFFNAEPWEHHIKPFTLKSAHYERIPKHLLYKYNAYDVYWSWLLREKFLDMLENDPPRRSLYRTHIMPMSHMLQEVSSGGVGDDVPLLEDIGARLDDAIAEELGKLREMLDNPKFNPGSWQQVQKAMEGLGYPVPNTREDTLAIAQREMPEDTPAKAFIDALLEYRGLNKLRGTYVTGILKRQRDGVFFPEFLVHGTTTGRLSSKNPNIQNMPRPVENDPYPIRKALVSTRPDLVVASTDYSQIELRTLAELCNDPAMIAAFRPGSADYFDLMMPASFPSLVKSLEDFYEYKKDRPDEAKNMRAKVKGVQYGMNYGRMAKAIATALNIPVADAEAIVNGIHETFPGLKVWQDNVRRAVTDPDLSHFLITPFNRVFQSEVITWKNKINVQNAALAFVPQSTASDICVTAAMEVHKRIGDYDGRITALVHDAIYYEAPQRTMEDLVKMVEREMIGAAAGVFHRVSFDVESGVGNNWTEV